MLEEADSALISIYKVFLELFSMLSRFMKGVISRDSVGFVVGEVDFNIGSYYRIVIDSLSS